MERIDRIRKMEEILRRGEEVCGKLEAALEDYAALRERLGELDAYYGSEDWFGDLDADRAGELPPDLNRGVLSEDEAYDLLTELRELREKMRSLSADTDA